ncbi:hypothetical protein Tco_1437087, partial [Tanacetum coccineum]
LKVTPWKGVVRFGKKGKLAPRYVGPFEILERIGLVAYRLRLPKELNIVHDTFHVLNMKKYLADANLHVPLDEIKVNKTLRFVKEPVESMDQEIKKLKRRKLALVKVRWNSKRGPEFTWEHEDQMRIKYPQLLVIPLEMAKCSCCVILVCYELEAGFEHLGGLLTGTHGMFSGRTYCLVRRTTCGYPWPKLEGKRFENHEYNQENEDEEHLENLEGVQHLSDNAAGIHEDEIGEDGLINIDIEIEGEDDELLNLLWFFPWEGLAVPDIPYLEAQSALRIHEVVPNKMTPEQNAYDSRRNDHNEVQAMVTKLEA